MRERILIICGVLALIFGGIYYLIYHSGVPVSLTGSALTALGFETENLTGSLSSGVRARSIRYQGELNTFDVRDLSVQYSNDYSLFSPSKLHFSEITASKLLIDINQPEKESSGESTESFEVEEKEVGVGAGAEGEPLRLKIDRLDLRNIFIKLSATAKPLTVDRFLVEGFDADQDRFTVNQVDLKSNFLDLHVQPTGPPAPETGPRNWQMRGALKGSLIGTVKQTMDFSGEAWRKDQKNGFKLSGLDQGFNLFSEKDGTVRLQFNNLKIDRFLETAFPLRKINAAFQWGNLNEMQNLERYRAESGTLVLGKTAFDIEPGPLMHPKEGETDEFNSYVEAVHRMKRPGQGELRVRFLFAEEKNTGSPVRFRIVESGGLRPDDVLAYLYYGARYKTLSSQKRKTLEEAKPYFEMKS